MVKNLPSNAGYVGLIPGWGTKIPHAAGQLSLCAATTEPVHSGACASRLERSPLIITKRSCMLEPRPDAAKKKKSLYRKKLNEDMSVHHNY